MYTGIRLLLLFVCLFLHSSFSPIFNIEIFRHGHFSRELWGLEDWKLVHTMTVDSCIMLSGIRQLLLIHLFISSVFCLSNSQHWNFSKKLWGLEGWNFVHTWTVGICIMYTGIRLLLLIHLFISSFFVLFNFQHCIFSSHFSREQRGLEDWKLVHTWTVGRCIMYTGIRLLLLIRPFISSFFLLSNFQFLNFSSRTLFSGTMSLEDWKLVHTLTVGRCIMLSGIRLLLLIHLFISSVYCLSNCQHWIFSQELWGLEGWTLVHTWTVGRCIMYTGIRLLLLILFLFLHFSFSSIFNIEIFRHTFLGNCEA